MVHQRCITDDGQRGEWFYRVAIKPEINHKDGPSKYIKKWNNGFLRQFQHQGTWEGLDGEEVIVVKYRSMTSTISDGANVVKYLFRPSVVLIKGKDEIDYLFLQKGDFAHILALHWL